jgi:general stress protein 26
MIHLKWLYGGAVDICNITGDVSKIDYNIKLKLLISSCINTKKTENIKNNPYVSVLLAKADLQGLNLTCNLHMNIWGEAHIYENGEMKNIWNSFFTVADANVKNFFYPEENGMCIILVESNSCKLIDNGESWK